MKVRAVLCCLMASQYSNNSPLGNLPSLESIQQRINDRYDDLFHTDAAGKRHAYVCTVCDNFITHRQDLNWYPINKFKTKCDLLRWDIWGSTHDVVPELAARFTFKDIDNRIQDKTWLNGVALSSRGVIGRKSTHHLAKYGFSCCCTCTKSLDSNKTPFYSIVNKNDVGHPPPCLTELTPVELALISPVFGNDYGYYIQWTGGDQVSLRGHLSLMRVKERDIVRATENLQAMGLTKHVLVILTGPMTDYQKKQAQKSVRTEKVIAAVEWLCCNHRRWKNVDVDSIRQQLQSRVPVVIDNSTEAAGSNSNIEQTEQFSCYFPDGTTNEHTGGFDTQNEFKKYVDDMQRKNFDVTLKVQFEKEYLGKQECQGLMDALLLQFPYGRGGLDEKRFLEDGTLTDCLDTMAYFRHLTLLSQPVFQHQLFLLIVYSLYSKTKLLKSSRLQLKGKHSATALAQGLSHEDLRRTINSRLAGDRNAGDYASKTLLYAVDAMSQALPHTNEASRKARSTGEAMQHHFGVGSIFLTVNFDDENSFLMQTITNVEVDSDTPVDDLTDDECALLVGKRRQLRVKYPGASALNFEMLLNILCEDVIGWNIKTHEATEEPGLFGECEALAIAFEEQQKKTVHGHFTIWIKGYDMLRQVMFFGNENQKAQSSEEIIEYHDRLINTSLFRGSTWDLKTAFDHVCSYTKQHRTLPIVREDQALRHFRHKHGYEYEEGTFAYCEHCPKTWTYEQMVEQYTRIVGNIEDKVSVRTVDKELDIATARMLAKIVEFQKEKDAEITDTICMCINAKYQCHESKHVPGCFKCNRLGQKRKREHVCGPNCECRFRLPDRKRARPTVRTLKEGIPWYQWDGTSKQQPLIELLPKRERYDLFQNVACKAISESKFSCNSNISVITDGPVSQYQFKYQHKQTQDDDQAEYSQVDRTIKSLTGRVHDDDKAEAVRLICRAAFAHNCKNVIGCPLAAFLIRNGSRFYFSHDFVYCPVKDLIRLQRQQTVTGEAKYDNKGNVYFENLALHYLCRPEQLEHLSAADFYAKYDVVTYRKPKKNDLNPILRMQSYTGHYQHPSAKQDKKGGYTAAKQGVRLKPQPSMIKVPQWMFVDTAKFKTNIFSSEIHEITNDMEKHALLISTLFCPHRSVADLHPMRRDPNGRPFTVRLRELSEEDCIRREQGHLPVVFTDDNIRYLQNIQNCAYNSMRYKVGDDDLQAHTVPFNAEVDGDGNIVREDDDEDEDMSPTQEELMHEDFIQQFDNMDIHDQDPAYLNMTMQNIGFSSIRDKGVRLCGHTAIPEVDVDNFIQPDGNDFVKLQPPRNTQQPQTQPIQPPTVQYTVKHVVKLILSRTISRTRDNVFKYNPGVQVCDANGSIGSILEWANAAKLDTIQKRSFECMLAAFLLTFHKTALADDSMDHRERMKLRRNRQHLLTLKNGGQVNFEMHGTQLIMLLHGPGGSGKTTVINLVTAYAREYCGLLGHPFTSRTIVITAMSGAAAILLHGETTHKALNMNGGEPSQEMIDQWSDTRLLFIDECSFAGPQHFQIIHDRCQTLSGRRFGEYGGMNVVFSGDYSQLSPPMITPIYDDLSCSVFHNQLNCFVELDGTHRFKDDPDWGIMLLRFRRGAPTIEDIRTINDNCLVDSDTEVPDNIQVATFRNRDRDAINCAIFEQYCVDNQPNDGSILKEAAIIFMDDLCMKESTGNFAAVKSNNFKKYFWTQVGEDAINGERKTVNKRNGGRYDPALKVYPNCPLMLTTNTAVAKGEANGARVYCNSVNAKIGEQPFIVTLENGTKVRAFYASQIKSITVTHEMEDIVPRTFDVEATQHEFKTSLKYESDKITVHMKGHQFAMVSNSATTGHKLQGYTALSLLVNDWTYQNHWAYVVLSRVRTMNGLYLREPLSEDLEKYEMADSMKDMIRNFQRSKDIGFLTPAEYEALLNDESN